MNSARTLHYAALMSLLALVSACASDVPPGQVPLTGINGNSGGAISTIYYDEHGKPHFHI